MTPEKIERDRTAGTPGPWRVGPVDDTVVIAPDGSEVAAIDGDYNEPDLWPVMEANACRIARLPELEQAYLDLTAEVRRLTAERDAALAGAVRVKPLVFQFEPYDKEPSDKARSDGTYVVRTEHEFYRVIPVEGGRFMAPSVSLGTFPTLEDAFETVQKHHEARIRAALEPAAPSVSAAAKVLLESKTVRTLLAAGKKIDAEELLSALAAKENSDE